MMGLVQVPDRARAQTDRRRLMMGWGSARGCACGDPATHHHRRMMGLVQVPDQARAQTDHRRLMMGLGPVALAPVAWG